jgi:hypothetical protein
VARGARGVERSETTRAPPTGDGPNEAIFRAEPIRREQPCGSCAANIFWGAPLSDSCPGETAVTNAQWGDCA